MKTRRIIIITLLLLVAAMGMSQRGASAEGDKKYMVAGTVKTITGEKIVNGKVLFQDVFTGDKKWFSFDNGWYFAKITRGQYKVFVFLGSGGYLVETLLVEKNRYHHDYSIGVHGVTVTIVNKKGKIQKNEEIECYDRTLGESINYPYKNENGTYKYYLPEGEFVFKNEGYKYSVIGQFSKTITVKNRNLKIKVDISKNDSKPLETQEVLGFEEGFISIISKNSIDGEKRTVYQNQFVSRILEVFPDINIKFAWGTDMCQVVLQKDRTNRREGVILDVDGKPLSYASIRFRDSKNRYHSFTRTTDENGWFKVILPSGEYNVQILNRDKKILEEQKATIVPELTSLKIQLKERLYQIKGTVMNRGVLEKLSDLNIATENSEGWISIETDANGCYQIQLKKGIYSVNSQDGRDCYNTIVVTDRDETVNLIRNPCEMNCKLVGMSSYEEQMFSLSFYEKKSGNWVATTNYEADYGNGFYQFLKKGKYIVKGTLVGRTPVKLGEFKIDEEDTWKEKTFEVTGLFPDCYWVNGELLSYRYRNLNLNIYPMDVEINQKMLELTFQNLETGNVIHVSPDCGYQVGLSSGAYQVNFIVDNKKINLGIFVMENKNVVKDFVLPKSFGN